MLPILLTAHRALFSRSLVRWPSSEALLSWPDLLSDPSIMGNTIQKLKRGRASRHLGLEAPLAAEEDSLSLGVHQGQPRYFSASGGCEQRCSVPGLECCGEVREKWSGAWELQGSRIAELATRLASICKAE